MNQTHASRKSAHLVGALCAAALVGSWAFDIFDLSANADHVAIATAAALIAIAGGVYAVRKASRWWYALVVASALTLIVCLMRVGE